ncbi:hypothetical protein [Bradyrhizobium yuanmingense]|uniref:hypothetical protein n=1 Tax=Bradyrhizobium yuanmingense TaxID=108015 RepID=UPI003D2F17EC
MASIPTASVDALVHVNAYGGRKRRGCSLTAQVGWFKLGLIVRDLQSFEAWQIAAIMKPFQWFADYRSFAYVSLGENRGNSNMSIGPVISAAGRNTIVVALAGLALIAASASPSAAASAGSPAAKSAVKTAVAGQAASDVTDFSAHRRRHYHRRGPNAAGLAFMGMAAGLIGGAIAESRRREYYENRYYYGYGPRYYGGPGYYGGSGYYYDPGYRYAPY